MRAIMAKLSVFRCTKLVIEPPSSLNYIHYFDEIIRLYIAFANNRKFYFNAIMLVHTTRYKRFWEKKYIRSNESSTIFFFIFFFLFIWIKSRPKRVYL